MPKHIVYLMVLLGVVNYAFSQNTDSNKTLRYHSSIEKLETLNKSTGEWDAKNYTFKGLVIIDFVKRKIITYSNKKDTDLDFISINSEKVNNTETYTLKCVDAQNTECNVTLAYLNNHPLFLRIEYDYFKASYYFDDNQ